MQDQGGSQYGLPQEITPFAGTSSGTHMPGDVALPESASPISSRPPELVPEYDVLIAGEERGTTGNRWPRQETLALLKIRSEMDSVFKDSTLKGPLWEDVSRKLGELGYRRSSKKCKEKFENVHKYYKRTKEGRAGKSYRFFSELEALHNTNTMPENPSPAGPISVGISSNIPMEGSSVRIQPPSSSGVVPPTQINAPRIVPDLTTGPAAGMSGQAAGISFSSSSSSSGSDSEDEIKVGLDSRKRKRSGGGRSRKMMDFFEGMMKQVMEKQEEMQQRFLVTIEKMEQDRMMREEAWKSQERVRIARENENMAQERAISAARDAAVISFLQKLTGEMIPVMPPPVIIPSVSPPQPTPTPPPPPLPPQQQEQQHQQSQQWGHSSSKGTEFQTPVSSMEIVPQEQHEIEGGLNFDPASSRWPKSEVNALIQLRSGLENRYQEAGPKGPLWEEISGGMRRLGYNRSAKRCKEKWENINKYFKKVKESNKKRPEDAKTCPYFHQLDALYRRKIPSGGAGSSSSLGNQNKQDQEIESDRNPNQNPQEGSDTLAIMLPPPEINKNVGNPGGGGGGGAGLQVPTSNGGSPASFFEGGDVKK
ncbi:trihelix transcription factor GTL1-like isoform X2 [Tasmannia lanceolata]